MRRHCFFDVHLKFEISYSQLQTLKLMYFLQVGESSLAKGFVEDPNHKVGLLYSYFLYTAKSILYFYMFMSQKYCQMREPKIVSVDLSTIILSTFFGQKTISSVLLTTFGCRTNVDFRHMTLHKVSIPERKHYLA